MSPLRLALSRRASDALTAVRAQIVERVRLVNGTTEQEVTDAAHHVSIVVDRARRYVEESQRMLGSLEDSGQDGLATLLSAMSTLVRGHVKDMTARAAAQDERARRAAKHAKNIMDLAVSIDRLAGEARLLAVNARIESSRMGAQSAGFEVLAAEMQRLSDEVAAANERVEELAAQLGRDLPAIADHAQQLRASMAGFAQTATQQIDDTDRGVSQLRWKVEATSRQGAAAIDEVLTASRAALSHLQFQDVVAQQLRQIDSWLHDAQKQVVQRVDADPTVAAEIPPPEYTTLGDHETSSASPIADAGDVTLF